MSRSVHVIRAFRHLPRPLVEWGLATAAIADGILRNRRYWAARDWAAARGVSGLARERLALALLANHGRYLAAEALVIGGPAGEAARGVEVHGADRLDALGGRGALLLGFHLGPPNAWLALRALGYPVQMAVRVDAAADRDAWVRASDAGFAVPLADDGASSRAAALYRLQRLLTNGALVAITADGPFGAERFRIDFPGGPVLIRGGWLSLRRATRAPAFPTLTHTAGSRISIVIHPALPDPLEDEAADAAQCHAALAPLITSYVERNPSQCRWLATEGWEAARRALREQPAAVPPVSVRL